MSDAEYPEAPFDTNREPTSDLEDDDIVDEWQLFAGLLVDTYRPHEIDWHEYAYERKTDLWNQIRERADTEPPACPECGSTRWSQSMGDPMECHGCGAVASAELEEEVHSAWQAMKAELREEREVATDGGVDQDEIEQLTDLDGIGSQTAHDLLSEYGSLDELVADCDPYARSGTGPLRIAKMDGYGPTSANKLSTTIATGIDRTIKADGGEER